MITVKGLCKNFEHIEALKDINFTISRGEIVALLGPNGAGKTTLIRLLTGLLSPSEGEIFYNDEKLSTNRVAVLSQIGYIPENAPIYKDMSTYEFLHYTAQLKNLSADIFEERLKQLIKSLELTEAMNRQIGELSKGFRHRVAIAAAVLHAPDILILDEPSEGLDPNQKFALRKFIQKFAARGLVIISTHIMEDVEALAGRIILLNNGRIIEDTTPFKLKYKMPDKDLSSAFRRITSSQQAQS